MSKGASRTSTASEDENRASSGSRPSSRRPRQSLPVPPESVAPTLALPLDGGGDTGGQSLYVGRQEAVQVQAGQLALNFGCRANAHAEELDEARCGALVESVAVAVGCQLDAVELLRR